MEGPCHKHCVDVTRLVFGRKLDPNVGVGGGVGVGVESAAMDRLDVGADGILICSHGVSEKRIIRRWAKKGVGNQADGHADDEYRRISDHRLTPLPDGGAAPGKKFRLNTGPEIGGVRGGSECCQSGPRITVPVKFVRAGGTGGHVGFNRPPMLRVNLAARVESQMLSRFLASHMTCTLLKVDSSDTTTPVSR